MRFLICVENIKKCDRKEGQRVDRLTAQLRRRVGVRVSVSEREASRREAACR
ncbi:hypothetical protein [Nostoc sp.]|uniref:hypothetical protein n=1 Tax=Nostoc sp. TaxID=1180 RepID=UPI002FFAA491